MDGIVGVDVSKARLDVALLSGERVRRYQGTNDAAGHRAIGHWLARWGVGQAHICLEATGAYGFEFACLMGSIQPRSRRSGAANCCAARPTRSMPA